MLSLRVNFLGMNHPDWITYVLLRIHYDERYHTCQWMPMCKRCDALHWITFKLARWSANCVFFFLKHEPKALQLTNYEEIEHLLVWSCEYCSHKSSSSKCTHNRSTSYKASIYQYIASSITGSSHNRSHIILSMQISSASAFSILLLLLVLVRE
jgi:hypothetical protein